MDHRCLTLILLLLFPSHLNAKKARLAPKASDVAVTAVNQLAVDLYAKVRASSGGKNIFFSPLSISTALAMTYAGASGQTARQMARTLHLPAKNVHRSFAALLRTIRSRSRHGNRISVANALWGKKGQRFNARFRRTLSRFYSAPLRQINFASPAAGNTINHWVKRATRNKIPALVPEGVLDAQTVMVLTNAVYFAGKWQSKFKGRYTRSLPFRRPNASSVMVPLMKQSAKLAYAETSDLQILELPYRGKQLSMVVLLPRRLAKGGRKGPTGWARRHGKVGPAGRAAQSDPLALVENRLDADWLKQVLSPLREQKVIVYLPRFRARIGLSLASKLELLGMVDAFSRQAADFTRLTGKRDTFLSHVLHEAFIEVNETGTKAAAATAVLTKRKRRGDRTVTFRADHPFVFLIRDRKSGVILFLGRLVDPRA